MFPKSSRRRERLRQHAGRVRYPESASETESEAAKLLRAEARLTVFLSLKVGVGGLTAGPILIDSSPKIRRRY